MAETLDLLRRKRDAAEEAARDADLEAGRGVPGATQRAETLHREAQFYSARIARLETDPAEHLAVLYTERATVVANSDSDALDQIDALAARPATLDRQIDRLENPDGTIQ